MPSWSQLSTLYKRHLTLVTLVVVYSATRIFSGFFLQLTFARYGPGIGDFVNQARLSASGAYPFLDYWMEYPIIFPWLNVAAYQLSLRLPGDHMHWYATLYRWTFVPFDVGTLILLYALARRLYATEAVVLRVILLYTLCFVTLYVPLGWFDSVPLFWLLLALYFALENRPVWTGVAAGLGFLTKLIPVLVLPMAWQRMTSARAKSKLILASLASALLPMLPFILYRPDLSWAFVRNVISRPSWETVWALLDGYRGFGVTAPYDWRLDPDSATWATHASTSVYGIWSLVGFGLLALFLWTRRIDWQDNRRATAFVALTWCLFSLWSKGYSPQWAINYIPFVVLLMPTLRGALYLVLLSLGMLAEWPGVFILLPDQPGYFDAVILWRTALTLLLTLEFGTLAVAQTPFWQKLRLGYAGLLVGLMLSAFSIGLRAADQYADLQAAQSPFRTVVTYLQRERTADAGLVCRQIEVCEGIAPYIPELEIFWFPMQADWQTTKLTDFASQHRDLWLVETVEESGEHNLVVEQWLSQQYHKVAQEWVDDVRLARFVTIPSPALKPVDVQFGHQIRLTGFSVNQAERYFTITLRWESSQAIDVPYKLFIHLLDATGAIIAQNDQYPAGGFAPPTAWQPQVAVEDKHGLILPSAETAGYSIQIGWYLPETDERLPITFPVEMAGQQVLDLQP